MCVRKSIQRGVANNRPVMSATAQYCEQAARIVNAIVQPAPAISRKVEDSGTASTGELFAARMRKSHLIRNYTSRDWHFSDACPASFLAENAASNDFNCPGSNIFLIFAISSLASWSHRSLPACPACPLSQCHLTLCLDADESSARQRSAFLTGCFDFVLQPLRFQFHNQPLTPFLTYSESVWNSTSQGSLSALSASMAACNSIRLFVVAGSPPLSSRLCCPCSRTAAQPPGPGFPWQPPSEWMITFFIGQRRGG